MSSPYEKLPGWVEYVLIPLINLTVAFLVAIAVSSRSEARARPISADWALPWSVCGWMASFPGI